MTLIDVHSPGLDEGPSTPTTSAAPGPFPAPTPPVEQLAAGDHIAALLLLDPLDRVDAAAAVLAGLTFPVVSAVDVGGGLRRFTRAEGSLRVARAAFLSAVETLSRNGECGSAAEELVRHTQVSPKTAGSLAKESQILEAMPHVADKVAQGSVSSDHTAVLGSVLDSLDEPDRAAWVADHEALAGDAAMLPPAQFRREIERRRQRELAQQGISRAEQGRMDNTAAMDVNLATGRTWLRLDADPVTGLLIRQEVDAEVDRMIRTGDWGDSHLDKRDDRSHLRFHALVRLITRGAIAVDGVTPTLAELARLVVHVDIDTITERLGDSGEVVELEDGTPLSAGEVRQMACCAEIIPVVMDGHSVVLDEGRAKRLATPAQRIALSAMYAACAAPGCEMPFHRCQIHHIDWWEHGGPTDLDLLVPLCAHHHHRIHDDGWHITLDPITRLLTVQRPDHTVHDQAALGSRRQT